MSQATMWIAMLHGVSGGRADGRDWPPPGVSIEVPWGEGVDLLNGGHAIQAEPPAVRVAPWALTPPSPPPPPPAPYTPPAEPAATMVSEPAFTAAGPVPAAPAPEPEPEPEPEEVSSPAPGDPKQAWIEYAVSQGAKPDVAAAMTKVDLMSRYGGRL